MSVDGRGRHSLGVGSRPSHSGGIGVCGGQVGADVGVEEAIVNCQSRAAPTGPRKARPDDRLRVEPGMTRRRHVNTPTIAPIRQVVSVPETTDFNPSELISSRRCGAMVPRPPIMMPRLPKLAKPHIAYSMISRERGSSASAPSFDR